MKGVFKLFFSSLIAVALFWPCGEVFANKPDLYIGSIALTPAVGPPGGEIKVTFSIHNGGTVDAGPFNVAIYFSSDATLDSKDSLLQTLTVKGLASGRSTTMNSIVSIPSNASVNTVAYIHVKADSGSSVSELNETNNTTSATFNVKEGPDLTVTSLSADKTTVKPGETVVVTYTIENIGQANSSYFQSRLYLSPDLLLDSQDRVLDTVSIQYLAYGNSIKLVRYVWIPSNITTGKSYYIGAFVDYNRTVPERNERNNTKLLSIQVVKQQSGVPDFRIEEFTLFQNSQRQGERVDFRLRVKNLGNAQGRVRVEIQFGTDKNFTQSYRLTYYYVTIGAGRIYSTTSYFSVPYRSPFDSAPKTYYVRAIITSSYPKELTTQNNNTVVLPFNSLKGRSNLDLSSISFTPKTCEYPLDSNNQLKGPYNRFIGSFTIVNSGYWKSEPTELAIFLSDDNIRDARDIKILSFQIPPLDRGQRYQRNFNQVITAAIPPGRYYFYAQIDPDGKMTNDRRLNLFEWLFVRYGRPYPFFFTREIPDFEVVSVKFTPPQSAKVGTSINYEIQLRNNNPKALPNTGCYYHRYSSSSPGLIAFSAKNDLSQPLFQKNHGQIPTGFTVFTGSINIPSNIKPQKGFLGFKFDPQNVHLDSNKSNNIKVVPYTLLSNTLDFVVHRITLSKKELVWEDRVNLKYYLNNLGTLNNYTYIYTCFWYSKDQKLDSSDKKFATYSRYRSLSHNFDFTVPRWPEGDGYIIAKADCNNRYKEGNEDNNTLAIPIKVRKFKVDFFPLRIIAIPNQIQPNVSTTVVVEVKNKGPDLHIRRVSVCLYYSKDDKFDPKDSLVRCTWTSDIYGYYGVAKFTITNSRSFLAGLRYFFAQIDSGWYCGPYGGRPSCPTDKYDETDETNNMASVPVYIRNDVDLTGGAFSLSKTTATVGDSITFRFQIKNIATDSTNTPFDVLVIFSNNEVIEKTDTVIRKLRLPTLNGRRSSSLFAVTYTLPKSVMPGERYFGLIIDSQNEVAEIDETNNYISLKINVLTPGVDLQVTKLRTDKNVVSSSKPTPITVTYNIRNFGATPSPKFTIGYYLSTDPQFEPTDTLIKSRTYNQSLPSLANTGDIVEKLSISLNRRAKLYLLVVADPQNQLQERYRQNNYRAVAISLVNQKPKITSLPPLRAIEKQLYTYQAKAFDPDGDPISWRLVQGPVGMNIDSKSGKVTWTPRSIHGDRFSQVTIEAVDSRGGAARQSFKIFVQGVNDAPKIISTPPQRALAGSKFSYPVKAYDPDLNDTLNWVLLKSPPTMQIDPNTGLITWNVPANLVGQKLDVSVQVYDKLGASDKQDFVLLVVKKNSPPKITSTPPAIGYEGELYRYQALARDSDIGDTLTWSKVSGPTKMNIDALAGILTWKVPPGLAGQSVKVTIRVSDQVGGYDEQTFSISIMRKNSPPKIVSKPPEVAYAGKQFLYQPRAVDPDSGDKLTWSLLKSPPNAKIDSSSGLIQWTPTNADLGKKFLFTVKVEDLSKKSDTQGFYVEVVSYCNTDSDCPADQFCLLHRCRSGACFVNGCTDPAKPICSADGTCVSDLCKNVKCPAGEFCRDGLCVPSCAFVTCNAGEVCRDGKCEADPCASKKCPADYICQKGKCIPDPCKAGSCKSKNVPRICAVGTCLPDLCKNIRCPGKNEICTIDPKTLKPQCTAPSTCKVDGDCPKGQLCVENWCRKALCTSQNDCKSGEICKNGKCSPDPCAKVKCPDKTFCRDGQCIPSCAGVRCAPGYRCRDGKCEADPCFNKTCPSGQICIEGTCQKDLCRRPDACRYNRICHLNRCRYPYCADLICPKGGVCKYAQCYEPPACRVDRDCPAGMICSEGECREARCSPSNPCAKGELCRDGRCVPNPCREIKCPENSVCRDGICVPSCAGVFCPDGFFCKDGLCKPDLCKAKSCPQGSICWKGKCVKNICAPDSAGKPACRNGRICSPDGCRDNPCAFAPCPKGQVCSAEKGGSCYGELPCTYDLNCPPGSICNGGRCQKAACYLDGCPAGTVCRKNKCVKSLCESKNCPPQQACIAGKCKPICNCKAGEICTESGCKPDPCLGVKCPQNKVCSGGNCVDKCPPNACKFGRVCQPGVGCIDPPCNSVRCPGDAVCRRGLCMTPCSEVSCPSGTTCKNGTCTKPVSERVDSETAVEPLPDGGTTEKTAESAQVDSSPADMTRPSEKGPDFPNPEELKPPEGCGCLSAGTTSLIWFAPLYLLGWAFRRRRKKPSKI